MAPWALFLMFLLPSLTGYEILGRDMKGPFPEPQPIQIIAPLKTAIPAPVPCSNPAGYERREVLGVEVRADFKECE